MSAQAQILEADLPLAGGKDSVAEATSMKPKLILAAIVLAAAGYLGHALWFNAHFVETDNAEVGGDIVPVSAKISGFVATVNVKENQVVKAGDLLVTMDDRDARAHLAQAEADLAAAMASVGRGSQAGQAVAQVQTAQAQAQQAQSNIAQAQADYDNAERELKRLQPLLERHLVSVEQVDSATAADRSAAARLQAARDGASASSQQVNVYIAALRGADAKLQSAKAARDLAANQLADTRVLASSDGVVSQKTIQVGQYMQPGQPMMNLVPQNDSWVTANLKETELAGISVGSKTEFTLDAYPGVKWEGTVESLSPATGSKFTLLPPDNATGNFTKVVQRLPVRIHVDGSQHPDLALRPGMSAVVTITRNAG